MYFVVCLFFFFFFNDTATTEIYTLSYTTLFRSHLHVVHARADHCADPGSVHQQVQGESRYDRNGEHDQPIGREGYASDKNRLLQRARRRDWNRIAAPHHEAQVGDDERNAQGHEHLPESVSREWPQDQSLDQTSEHRDDDSTDDRCKPEIGDVFQDGDPDVRPEHVHRAVGEIRDAHQTEDQREARGEQEQQAAEGEAVQGLDDPILHKRAGPENPAPLFALRGSRLQILGGRPIARIHRILQELLRLVGPELAHVRVGMDDAVHEAPVLTFDLADVNAADHVSVFVECNRPPGGFDLDAAHRLHESRLVLDVSLDRVQGTFEHRGLDVGRCGVEPRIVTPVDAEIRGETLVDRILDLRGVPAGSDDAKGFVTHVAQHRLVEGGHAADYRDLSPEAVLVELPEEAKAVRAGEAEEDAVHVGLELRDVGPVIGNGERREQLLHDLAARILEHALEAGAHLVSVRDVVGDRHHAFGHEM